MVSRCQHEHDQQFDREELEEQEWLARIDQEIIRSDELDEMADELWNHHRVVFVAAMAISNSGKVC